MIATCTGCNAIIVFAKHYRTGSSMPFDAEPIVLTDPKQADKRWVLNDGKAYPAQLAIDSARMVQAEQPNKVHESHWATCPVAAKFRR